VDVWTVSKPTQHDRSISDFGDYPESHHSFRLQLH
jgi:hypothetical protein